MRTKEGGECNETEGERKTRNKMKQKERARNREDGRNDNTRIACIELVIFSLLSREVKK